MIKIVNMIPRSLSGESSQDSEPNIAVNPANTLEIVGTAFTPSPTGGSFAPIYVSTDGGNTWSLRTVVPGNGSFGTGDITVGFATTGGTLYAGTLNGSTGHLNILRTSSFTSTTPMTLLVDRASEDQPWVVAGSVVVSGTSTDRVFVGNNDFNQPSGHTATVDVSQDARTAAAPAGFAPRQIERRSTLGQDGPPIRIGLHPDGTVYAAYHRWVSGTNPNITMDVVMTRDDNWGSGTSPFAALVDSVDSQIGQRVATGRFIRWNGSMGQERLGGDLAVAVDPSNSSNVWIAWCDRVGGSSGTDWTIHVSHSTDRGQTWSADVRTITNAKNPSLAVNSAGKLGFVFQQFTGTRWVTQLEITADAWATAATVLVLHTAPSNTPTATFLPYLGDYIRIISVGADFYGVFSGNNTPDAANFPNSVIYQRNADWTARTLLDVNNTTNVAPSIDPFFFHWSQDIIIRTPITRLPITRTPIVSREPVITPSPITPVVTPAPITRTPVISREPVVPTPITPTPITRTPIVGPGPVADPSGVAKKPKKAVKKAAAATSKGGRKLSAAEVDSIAKKAAGASKRSKKGRRGDIEL